MFLVPLSTSGKSDKTMNDKDGEHMLDKEVTVDGRESGLKDCTIM